MALLSSGAALIGPAIGVGTSVANGKKDNSAAQQGQQQSDPFGPYRARYAGQLGQLMSDPSSIQGMPVYKAMQQAAARTMAAQGYTGSGNALAAAANAGGQAYQSQFQDLALLSGANIQPGSSGTNAAGQIIASNNAQSGQLSQLLGHLFDTGGGGGGKDNGSIAANSVANGGTL